MTRQSIHNTHTFQMRHACLWHQHPVPYARQDETPPLTATQCLNIQRVTGSVLYYARAVDPTILMPLNDIATEKQKPLKNTSRN
jgi:hypothetical protein